MACKLRQYLLTRSNLIQTYRRQSSRKIATQRSRQLLCKTSTDETNLFERIKSMPNKIGLRKFSCTCKKSSPCENEGMDSLKYTTLADYTLDWLSDSIDEIISRHADHLETDVSLHSGVLTVNLAHLGTYVINKQTPNRQIWLSSPLSGPWRFDLVQEAHWISTKDRQHLDKLLSEELSHLLEAQIRLEMDLKDR